MSPYTPLHVSPFRLSELNETASRYDYFVASVSDDELLYMWLGWGVLAAIAFVVSSTVWVGLSLHRQARQSPFNLFLIYLMFPDVCMAGFCAINCFLNIANGSFVSSGWCRFQTIYLTFGMAGSAWMCAVILRELHKLLRFSHRRQRYTPPTLWNVTVQAGVCFAGVIILSVLAILSNSPLPHQTALLLGVGCMPAPYDTASSLFFYLVFCPLIGGIPVGYVFYVTWAVWRRELLPRTGKTRVLALTFFKLAGTLIVFWLPIFMLFFLTGARVSPWVKWAATAWSHVQGTASALTVLLKPDVSSAVREVWGCKWHLCRYNQSAGGDDEEDFSNRDYSVALRKADLSGPSSTTSQQLSSTLEEVQRCRALSGIEEAEKEDASRPLEMVVDGE